MKTEAFKKGKTSGNYMSHKEADKKELEYRSAAKRRALKNVKAKGGHKQGEREVRSKKAGFYVAGHKNYGDVYEA